MKSTERYGLCQWGPQDRILREDFNADNDITDTILGALDDELQDKLSWPEYIGGWPAGKSLSQSIGVMKGSFDWSQWDYVAVTLQFPAGEGITADQVSYWAKFSQLVPPTARSSSMLIFFPKHDATRPIEGLFLGKELQFFRLEDLSYQNFDYLEVRAENSKRFFTPLFKVYGGA